MKELIERIEGADLRTWSEMDKSEWARGPWDAEPDKVQWRDNATGLPCLIVRNSFGALCGYVGVSPGHPWHGLDYDDCRVGGDDEWPEVHGGLTFAGGCQHGDPATSICHIPEPGEPDNVWWLGFDCAHSGDKSDMTYPVEMRDRPWHNGDVYRDLAYVQRECANLATQARTATAKDDR